MKRKVKQILSLLLCMLLLCAAVPMQASAETYSGNCGASGSNVTWIFDTETGELIISGAGRMKDYYSSLNPWGTNDSFIKTVTIGDGVTYVGAYAFSGCINLTNVTIPDSVKSIGKEAFSYCESISSLTIPDSVTFIGNYAFENVCNIIYSGTASGSPWGARSLNGFNDGFLVYDSAEKRTLRACSGAIQGTVTIPSSVTTIGECAFQYCTNLTRAIIPDSVTAIGKKVFWGCTGLKSATIGNGVKIISDSAFFQCESLTSVTIGNNVTSIDDWAFDYCKSLTSVTIPNGVTDIGDCAFLGCTGLTSMTIPDSVTNIGEEAFSECTSLSSVKIGNGVTTVSKRTFAKCTNLLSVTIGSSVKIIEENAFSGCTSLSNGKVSYNGTKSGWGTIQIKDGNDPLLLASRSYHPLRGLAKNAFVRFLIKVFLFGWIWYKG